MKLLQKTATSEKTDKSNNRPAFLTSLFYLGAAFVLVGAGTYPAKDDKKSSEVETSARLSGSLTQSKASKKAVVAVDEEPNWRGKQGRCLLKISGKKFIVGRCWVRLETDGSFQIMSRNESYFAQLLRLDGKAIGYWNKTVGSSHAHATLGVMTRSGACWKNNEAEICAWSL
jgi:phage gpG-like protein